MTQVNRTTPKPLNRLQWEKHIPISLGPVVYNGAADTQPDSEAYFLFYTDRDMVIDEAILFVGERYENSTTAQAVTGSLRYIAATFDAVITDADKASVWTNTLATKAIGVDYAALEKKAHLFIGPTSDSVRVPAGSFVALVMVDAGGTYPLRRITGASMQLRGYYPKA